MHALGKQFSYLPSAVLSGSTNSVSREELIYQWFRCMYSQNVYIHSLIKTTQEDFAIKCYFWKTNYVIYMYVCVYIYIYLWLQFPQYSEDLYRWTFLNVIDKMPPQSKTLTSTWKGSSSIMNEWMSGTS